MGIKLKKKSRKCSDCKGKGYRRLERINICIGCINLYQDYKHLVDCIKCNSNGYILIDNILFRCPKCGGRGEVDWVEQVITNPKKSLYPRPDTACLMERYKEDNNITYPGSVVKLGWLARRL